MTVLHIINKSPYERNSLDTCLRLAKKGAALLFIEDGVYAAHKNGGLSEKLNAAIANHSVYALQPDLEARGIDASKLNEAVTLVDYDGFVKLTTEHSNVQSWL